MSVLPGTLPHALAPVNHDTECLSSHANAVQLQLQPGPGPRYRKSPLGPVGSALRKCATYCTLYHLSRLEPVDRVSEGGE